MKRIFSLMLGLAVALSALQAQNVVTISDVDLEQGESALLSVELTNETLFSAFQMDLLLPEGMSVVATFNEDGEEVLDITLGEERKKSSHSLSYNVLKSGAIRVASFSSTNATYDGESGEIVTFRIEAADSLDLGVYEAQLSNVVFTTPDAVDFRLSDVNARINYSSYVDVEQLYDVELQVASPYGRCICDGFVIEPNDLEVYSGMLEHGFEFNLYFVPFDGYMAKSLKRNGEIVTIQNNSYAEELTEGVVFSEVNYVSIVDTLVMTEVVVDTLVMTETVVDTLVLTETVVDTLVLTETVVDTLVLTETVVDTLVLTETVVDTLVLTETVVDTLVLTETVVDTLVLTETIVDTLVQTLVDTMLVEKWDTIFVAEIEELPIPVITCDSGVVTITCEDSNAIILYAIDGDPIEGSVYVAPFHAPDDVIISAVAVRCGEVAVFDMAENGIEQAQMRVVSRRYYTTDGVEVTSPKDGVTIVIVKYEDGTTSAYKMVKK